MLPIINSLTRVLQADERLVINGKMAKNKVVELALNLDSSLLKLLLTDEQLKNRFFQEVDTMLVFDKIGFQRFVNNKNFLPDSYTQFKNHIGLTVDMHYLSESNDVVLSWPYKDCVLEGGQIRDDQKRNEIFWNETLASEQVDNLLAPKAFTNFKKFDEEGEHTDFTIKESDNFIIKGNNLLALHSIKKRYLNKIKLIYIDPPYNTQSDSFKYNDKFNHSTWLTFMANRLKIARELLTNDGVIFIQCDDNEQAYLKVLLDEIFSRECFVKTLHIQMSNVQGEKVKAAKQGSLVKNGEYIHVYSKNGSKQIGKEPLYEPSSYDTHYSIFINDDYSETTLSHVCSENETIRSMLINSGITTDKGDATKITITHIARAYEQLKSFRDFIHDHAQHIARTDRMVNADDISTEKLEINKSYEFKHKSGKIYLYGIDTKGNLKQRFLLSDKLRNCDDYYNTNSIATMRGDWWPGFHIDLGNINKESNVHLDNGQKPERLLENIIKFCTYENDYILDYHLGSGTTAAVAHKMNRKYIGIEQLNYGSNDSKERLIDVIHNSTTNRISAKYNWQGGGSFVYCELSNQASTFLDKIENANTVENLFVVWDELKENSNLSYKVDPRKFDKSISLFRELTFEDQQRFLIEAIDKNQLYVNYSDIDDETNSMSEQDKKLNKQFYGA